MTTAEAAHPGTVLWHAWSIFDDANVQESAEFSLYSDSWFTNIIRAPDWPVHLMPAMPDHTTSGIRYAAVARMRWSPDPTFDTSEVKLATDARSHHGGDSGDEIAALLSLALGIRCRNGGITRRWLMQREGTEHDPLGTPIEAEQYPPSWQAPVRGRALLPTLPAQVDLATAIPLLTKFAATNGKKAALLVRAARQYSNALWIADADPNQAWLQLVSAVETIAATASGTNPLWKRTEEALPEVWAKLVQAGGDDHAHEVGSLLAPLAKSTDRFLNFIDKYLPPPPESDPRRSPNSIGPSSDGC